MPPKKKRRVGGGAKPMTAAQRKRELERINRLIEEQTKSPLFQYEFHGLDEMIHDKKLVIEVIQEHGYSELGSSVPEELRNDEDVVRAAIENHGAHLAWASSELCDKREIVLAAVKNFGFALEFASPRLRDDTEIVRIAIRSPFFILEFASERLRGNRELVLFAIQNHETRGDDILAFASPALRDDAAVVLAAVQKHGYSLKFASDALRDHPEIVFAAVRNHPPALKFASEALLGNRELILEAITRNPRGVNLRFASPKLRGDVEIACVAIGSCGDYDLLKCIECVAPEIRLDPRVVRLYAERKLEKVIGPGGREILQPLCNAATALVSKGLETDALRDENARLKEELRRLNSVAVFDVDEQAEHLVDRNALPAPSDAAPAATPSETPNALKALEVQAGRIDQVKRERDDAGEDRDDAEETLGYQVRTTNALQTKIDELAALALAKGADLADVNAIKDRPNT